MSAVLKLYLDLFLLFLGPILLLGGIMACVYAIITKNYKETEYYKATHIPYLQMRFDKGRSGEYYTYKYLKALPGKKQYLFNCYIPKEDGTTTEIDVILLHESGIYVFESKNYSGWIFGDEAQTKWTQTLPAGKGKSQKSYFFNPIIQNKVHIKWLQKYLQDEFPDLPFYSYIIFSDRCTLKNIKLTSHSHFVINRYHILQAVSQQISRSKVVLTPEKTVAIYAKLYPLTQADEKIKAFHIENIHKKAVSGKTDIPENARYGKTSHDKANYEKTNVPDKASICPRCGGKLVLRIAGKGERSGQKFYGCSNYLKCRYIRNINNGS